MSKISEKLSNNLTVIIKAAIKERFEQATEEIQKAILQKYDEELVDVVTDRNSKTNPNLYREEFSDRLSKFKYLSKNNGSFTIHTPDMSNFNFSGRLKVIETIMEGTAGVYVEINEEDYIAVFGKKPINQEPVDDYVSPKEKIYLTRYTGQIKKAENNLKKKFVRYPFSNTAPIDIFDAGQKFVDENINKWIDEAAIKAKKEFTRIHRGAKL